MSDGDETGLGWATGGATADALAKMSRLEDRQAAPDDNAPPKQMGDAVPSLLGPADRGDADPTEDVIGDERTQATGRALASSDQGVGGHG